MEMALLKPSKETENKLRWATWVEQDETNFQLYIPKQHVPNPWPGLIWAKISPFDGNKSVYPSKKRSMRMSDPVEVVLEFVSDHTRTQRWAPIGDRELWLIGEPYIPLSLIPPHTDNLLIHVEWDMDSIGQFMDVPTYRDGM